MTKVSTTRYLLSNTCCAGRDPAIHSHAKIDALVDPPAPFSFIPEEVLAGTASRVLGGISGSTVGEQIASLILFCVYLKIIPK